MGGLWTSARDLSKYVAFLMAAYPARDEQETGPIRRASAREMQQAWRPTSSRAFRRSVDGPLELGVSAYGYGLSNSTDCRYGTAVSHGGGLPGYGSLMLWLPEHGVGLIGMTNRTYTSPGQVIRRGIEVLHGTGALKTICRSLRMPGSISCCHFKKANKSRTSRFRRASRKRTFIS
jgi:CubicO group peptidase (beta-lactamase class C family)